MSIKLTSLMIIVMCAISAFAQAQESAASPTKAAPTQACYATFNTALPNFCVTENGNIEHFYYPTGYSQLFTDGYGVCDYTGTSNISYYDDGNTDSGTCQNSLITEPGAPH